MHCETVKQLQLFIFLLLVAITNALAFCHQSSRLYHENVDTDVEIDIKIRDSMYKDLNPVSDLMVASFYDNNPKDVFRHMYRLAELNRLQQNFPYMDQDRHRMLVAISSTTNDIIGFCDIDARPSSPKTYYANNPRPILSDLLVCPTMRRRGIARQLIEECENICLTGFKKREMFIRVLKKNEAAIQMYTNMGYEFIDNPGDPKDVCLLRKDLE